MVDETVRNVTSALHDAGLWERTVLVWCTDNGSPVNSGGSNFPLKGGKGSNWEGGTRVPAFVNGGMLPRAMRGRTLHGLAYALFTPSPPFCAMEEKVDFVYLIATVPGRHSGDQVHKVKKTAAPFFLHFTASGHARRPQRHRSKM